MFRRLATNRGHPVVPGACYPSTMCVWMLSKTMVASILVIPGLCEIWDSAAFRNKSSLDLALCGLTIVQLC